MLNSFVRAALLGLLMASCTPSVSIPCAGSSQCPAGDVCSAAGVCEAKADTLADGIVEVLAGGSIGDNGPAEGAILRGVDALAVADDGTIYVGENSHGLIRKITPDGIITTIAGNGVRGSTNNTPISGLDAQVAPGDFALKDGYLYFTDTEGDKVVRLELATNMLEFVASGFSTPRGIAIDDAGNIYVGDYTAYRVRRVDAVTGSVTTFAGTGENISDGNGGAATSAGVYGPWGVAVDADSLYVATYYGNRVRRIDLATGIISAYAGTGSENSSGDDGPATSAGLNSPRHLAFDSAGNLLIADHDNGRIRRVEKATGTISTIAGGNDCCFIAEDSPAVQTYLPEPGGFAVGPDDTVYLGDKRNQLLRQITTDGIIKTIAGGVSPEGDLGANARLNTPYGVTADKNGDIIFADRSASRVLRLDRKSGEVTLVAGTGRQGFSGDGSAGPLADLSYPGDVVADKEGNIYIGDTYNSRVRKVDPTGIISTFAGGGDSDVDGVPANMASLGSIYGLAIDADGNIYIAASNKVRKVNAAGIISTIAGTGTAATEGNGGPAIEASLYDPRGMVFDTEGRLYIAESEGNVIRRIDADGNIYPFVGTGTYGGCGDGLDSRLGCLRNPNGLAFGGDGSLYIADQSSHRIRRVDFETRLLSSVTQGGCCLSSSREEAHAARFYNPTGITALPDGSLIITEQSNGLVRRLSK
jgi:sugar lactone lactonase YvrE